MLLRGLYIKMAIINTGYVLCSIARFDCCRVFEVMTIASICLYGDGSKIGDPEIEWFA